ncbi:hypothetical protein K438DRAFT_1770121 [Mycena galopus ATCC 62051]|nr:hypothetical protein K438DRAFT_1770121 [Mycena galopus ATCC 62051]
MSSADFTANNDNPTDSTAGRGQRARTSTAAIQQHNEVETKKAQSRARRQACALQTAMAAGFPLFSGPNSEQQFYQNQQYGPMAAAHAGSSPNPFFPSSNLLWYNVLKDVVATLPSSEVMDASDFALNHIVPTLFLVPFYCALQEPNWEASDQIGKCRPKQIRKKQLPRTSIGAKMCRNSDRSVGLRACLARSGTDRGKSVGLYGLYGLPQTTTDLGHFPDDDGSDRVERLALSATIDISKYEFHDKLPPKKTNCHQTAANMSHCRQVTLSTAARLTPECRQSAAKETHKMQTAANCRQHSNQKWTLSHQHISKLAVHLNCRLFDAQLPPVAAVAALGGTWRQNPLALFYRFVAVSVFAEPTALLLSVDRSSLSQDPNGQGHQERVGPILCRSQGLAA